MLRQGFWPLPYYQTYPPSHTQLTIRNLISTIKTTRTIASAGRPDLGLAQANLTTLASATSPQTSVYRDAQQSMWYFSATKPWYDLATDLTTKFGQKVTILCDYDAQLGLGGMYKEGGFDGQAQLTQRSDFLCHIPGILGKLPNINDGIHQENIVLMQASTLPMDVMIYEKPANIGDLSQTILNMFAKCKDENLGVLLIFPSDLWTMDARQVALAYKQALDLAKQDGFFRAIVFAIDDPDKQAIFTNILGEKRLSTVDAVHHAEPQYYTVPLHTPAPQYPPWASTATQQYLDRLKVTQPMMQPAQPFEINPGNMININTLQPMQLPVWNAN